MKNVSLTPAVFHLPARVNAVADPFADNPVVPRGPKLRPILERVRQKIRRAVGCEASHQPVLLTCSGSGAIAATLGSCVEEGGILVVSNGAYGERQARYAEQLGLRAVHYALDYGDRPDLAEIERLAREHDVAAIGMVHGATSTCSLNPIREVGALARRLGCTYIVDGIASLFVEEIDLEEAGIDVMIASTNKGLHSNPDLAFVLVENDLLDRVCAGEGRIPYLDLGEAWRAQSTGSHPYTMNVRALLELEAALDVLVDTGGVAGRVATYRARNELLRNGYARLGLECFERPGMPFQNIGTALMLPEGVLYERLADALANWDDGSGECYEIYSAQGKLARSVFRIFNMGEYELSTYERFLGALEICLERQRG
jgi:2-aminoethylphosphonate-pyruvate transaminase